MMAVETVIRPSVAELQLTQVPVINLADFPNLSFQNKRILGVFAQIGTAIDRDVLLASLNSDPKDPTQNPTTIKSSMSRLRKNLAPYNKTIKTTRTRENVKYEFCDKDEDIALPNGERVSLNGAIQRKFLELLLDRGKQNVTFYDIYKNQQSIKTGNRALEAHAKTLRKKIIKSPYTVAARKNSAGIYHYCLIEKPDQKKLALRDDFNIRGLTAEEYQVLHYFKNNPGIISLSELGNALGKEGDPTRIARALRATIYRLRKRVPETIAEIQLMTGSRTKDPAYMLVIAEKPVGEHSSQENFNIPIPYIPLSPELKKELGQRLKEVRRLIGQTDSPSTLQREEKALEEQLTYAHARLVPWTLYRYGFKETDIPKEELIQEGFAGLAEAIKKYDPDIASLTTYAVFWIRNYMQKATRVFNENGIRISEAGQIVFNRVIKAQRLLEQEFGRTVSFDEAIKNLGLTTQEVEMAQSVLRITRPTRNLDQPMREGSTYTLRDSIQDTSDLNAEEDKAKRDLKLKKAFSDLFTDLSDRKKYGNNALTPFEISVLQLRFGFIDNQEIDATTVGNAFGVHNKTVGNTLRIALIKIRNSPHADALREYLVG